MPRTRNATNSSAITATRAIAIRPSRGIRRRRRDGAGATDGSPRITLVGSATGAAGTGSGAGATSAAGMVWVARTTVRAAREVRRGAGGVPPAARVVAHQLADQRREPTGALRLRHRLVDDPVEGADHVAVDRLVRRVSLHRVEDGRPQRPHVAGRRRRRAARHLRGEEAGRADEEAGPGELLVGLEPGDAEVAQLHLPLRRDQDVARLDVAVHDPRLVRGGQRCCGLRDQRRRGVGGERAAAAHQLGEVLRLDVLHHQPVLAGLLHQVEDHHHVLVVEPRRHLRLAAHPVEVGVGGAGQGADALGGDPPPQEDVLGQPHLAHAAAPDLALETVAAGNGGHTARLGAAVTAGLPLGDTAPGISCRGLSPSIR